MAQYQNQNEYPASKTQSDEFGNPIRSNEHGNRNRTDEYGNPNPTSHNSDTTTGTGIGGFDTTTTNLQGARHDGLTTGHGGERRHDQQQQQHHGVGHKDDEYNNQGTTMPAYYDQGQGDQQNKGMMDKVMEKIPGAGHKDKIHGDQYNQDHTTSTTTPGYNAQGHGQQPEKKGAMDKVFEKIPGAGNKDKVQGDQHRQDHTTSTTLPGYNLQGHEQQAEKKGVMEKIKEKLPGRH